MRRPKICLSSWLALIVIVVSVGFSKLPFAQEPDKKVEGGAEGVVKTNGKEFSFSSVEELRSIADQLSGEDSQKESLQPNYVEFVVKDLSKTKSFYESALGYEFADYGKEYATVSRGPIALGFAASEQEATPLLMIQTKDIEATFKKVESADAKIDKPIFSFPGGQRFEFRDPDGHRLGVFENE